MNDQVIIEPEQDLVVMPKFNMPAVKEVAEKINSSFGTVYTKLEQEIEGFSPDLSTDKGRKAIASLAFKISRVKTGLDDRAGALTDDQKALVDAVNKERKVMRETLDGMRDKVKKPLEDWKEKEKAREQAVLLAKDAFSRQPLEAHGLDCEGILERIKLVEDIPVTEDVFQSEYRETVLDKNVALEKLRNTLAEQEKRDRDAAELEELRAAKEKADAEEEQRHLAEVEKERIAKEKVESEKREQAAIQLAKEQAKAAAEEEIATAEREADTAKKAVATAKKEAEQRAVEAKKQADLDAEAAVQKERDEQAQKLKVEQEAADARAADLEHRRAINAAALQAMMKVSEVTEDQGKMIIQAISQDQIPHISISY